MNVNILDTIDPRQLGEELQHARNRMKLTQQQAADILGVARTTIVAIEKGERRIKPSELIKLARAYNQQVNDFVRPRPETDVSSPQFRAAFNFSEEDNTEIEQYVMELVELSRNYRELETITNSSPIRNYPPDYDMTGLTLEYAAEDMANRERNRLGLADSPIPNIRSILEQDVGIRIFYIPIRVDKSAKVSAIYIYDDNLGACIAINSLHPDERKRLSLAHDYAHFLAHRTRPEVLVEGRYQRIPEHERFADLFAIYFLMPTNSLMRQVVNARRSKNALTPADLLTLANYYGVSVEAMTYRLEDLRQVSTGTWERIKQSNFKIRDAQKELGLDDMPAHNQKLPMRYQYLALNALDEGQITEGQFARFLGTDRVEARKIAAILRGDPIDSDEIVHSDPELS